MATSMKLSGYLYL